jgi:hypothetical protein|tara:strand:- start:196 stop:432 length:237 start_codon:yes stop_codon:yes gene_type:complete
MSNKENYQVKAYVPAHGGYFTYDVGSKDQACHHAAVIMKEGVYRRINDANEMEYWPVYKVKVCGPGLDTEYPDTFVRT